jgi:hypothetical protein
MGPFSKGEGIFSKARVLSQLALSRFCDETFSSEQRSDMHKLLEKLKEEFFAILPPTIFFFVMLHIVPFIQVLMSEGSHFEPMSTASIAVVLRAHIAAGILKENDDFTRPRRFFHEKNRHRFDQHVSLGG